MKLCFVFGTRPEIIKLYSVMKAAEAHKLISPILVHTGQHYDYEMSQIFLEELKLPEIHHFLDVKSGPHGAQTALLLTEIEKCLLMSNPDAVIVLGDTNTTMAGALAAAKLQIPIAHIEAGCRSFDLNMPEEINRLVVDAVSSIFFAPSEVAALNLLFEGKPEDRVFLAGNTLTDIVEETREVRATMKLDHDEIGEFSVVLTLHRQENVDNRKRLEDILFAIGKIRGKIVFPIHPRTNSRIKEFHLEELVKKIPNLRLIKPVNYLNFMKILEEAKVVITDSGGVQEEAMLVGTPCITARDTTEWPETVWAGANYLAGTDAENITTRCNMILGRDSPSLPPSGHEESLNANAGKTIIEILVRLWKGNSIHMQKPDMTRGQYPLPWLLDTSTKSGRLRWATLTFDENGKAIVDKRKRGKNRVVRRMDT